MMYQCCWCWIYTKRYQELCPHCGAECVVMVTDEDYQSNRYTQGKRAFGRFHLITHNIIYIE